LTIFQGLSEDLNRVEPEEPPKVPCYDHPVMSSDGRALWYKQEAWVWVVAETDEESFYVHLDCDGPLPGWMEYLLECESLGDALFDCAYDGAEMAAELLRLGIAPDQPFFIRISFSSGIDYYESIYGEGWNETDWELLDREPLNPEEAERRWSKWLEVWNEGV